MARSGGRRPGPQAPRRHDVGVWAPTPGRRGACPLACCPYCGTAWGSRRRGQPLGPPSAARMCCGGVRRAAQGPRGVARVLRKGAQGPRGCGVLRRGRGGAAGECGVLRKGAQGPGVLPGSAACCAGPRGCCGGARVLRKGAHGPRGCSEGVRRAAQGCAGPQGCCGRVRVLRRGVQTGPTSARRRRLGTYSGTAWGLSACVLPLLRDGVGLAPLGPAFGPPSAARMCSEGGAARVQRGVRGAAERRPGRVTVLRLVPRSTRSRGCGRRGTGRGRTRGAFPTGRKRFAPPASAAPPRQRRAPRLRARLP